MTKDVAFLRAINIGRHAVKLEKILRASATMRDLTTIRKIIEKYQ